MAEDEKPRLSNVKTVTDWVASFYGTDALDYKKVEKIREKKLKFTFKEQKEFETIDSDIEILENKIISLDEEMSKYSSDFSKLQELMKEKEEVEKNLEFKYERWEYLNDLAQKIEESKKQ